MVFHWSLDDSKPPHFFLTALNILADLKKSVVWMVGSFPNFSSSSSSSHPLKPLGIVSNAPNMISIIVNFMFHSFYNFLARSKYVSHFFFHLNSVVSLAQLARVVEYADCITAEE